MNRPRLKLETILYASAFLLALVLRLVEAGRIPLDDQESRLALQALALSRGEETLLDAQPLYLMLTTLWFFLFRATQWTARFWPALAGSLLALVPLLYRERLGRLPAVLLAFFLALDPGLLAISRQAGGPVLAVLLLLAGVGFWLRRWTLPAGVTAGLALLSGPYLWPGVLSLAAALWVSGEWRRAIAAAAAPTGEPGDGSNAEAPAAAQRAVDGRRFLIAAALSFFFAGTLFFAEPRGLSAAAAGLPGYLQGWLTPGVVPMLRLFVTLLFYEFLPLIFGLWGGIRGVILGQRTDRFLVIWWAVALLLALVYPARQVADLAWPLIPLWALAARQMARVARIPTYDRMATVGQGLLAVVILAFISMTLATVSNNPDPARQAEYLFRLGGALVLLVGSTALIAWGWTRGVALKGLLWGFLAILGLYTLSASWNAAGFSGQVQFGTASREYWSGGPVLVGGDLLLQTIEEFDQWDFGQSGEPEVLVVGMDEPALRWALRDRPKTRFVRSLSGVERPALALTLADPDLALASAYRGQELALWQNTQWDWLRPNAWWRWLVYRRAPNEIVERVPVILWARSDIFPGGVQPAEQGAAGQIVLP